MREIKAHKGGRTERVYARVTPDEKRRIRRLLAKLGKSLSDYLMEHVDRDSAAQN